MGKASNEPINRLSEVGSVFMAGSLFGRDYGDGRCAGDALCCTGRGGARRTFTTTSSTAGQQAYGQQSNTNDRNYRFHINLLVSELGGVVLWLDEGLMHVKD